jgi:Ca-activated chloride channel homolog
MRIRENSDRVKERCRVERTGKSACATWWFAALLVLLYATAVGVSLAAGQSETCVQVPEEVGQGSLLYRSPVSGAYEIVPLTHTDAALDVRGLVASATVTQQYVNSSPTPIEAVYVFPLPHDAAVYDLEIHIGNRVIRSEIHEREEAKRVYQAAKNEGKRAALLEEERPNIFTASVANIMPGDHIDVRLRFVEPLKWEAGKMRLVFPMVVGPRYIPGTQAVGYQGTGWAADTDAVRDASRITPIVRGPETRPHDISISVDLDPGLSGASIKSISHQVKVTRLTNGKQRVELAWANTLPNKDFVLELEEAASTKPQTALFLSPSGDTGETQFLLAAYPPTVQPQDRGPMEMQYVIDVSGSMMGTSIEQARGALLQALDRLRPSDRFGILAFNHHYQEFAPVTLLATAENVAAGRQYVRSLQAGGGTEMLLALTHVMTKPQTPGTTRHIILLTDGDLGNEEQIFLALRRNLGDARLYVVAIGSEPNLFLATKMARFGRGAFTHIADNHEIESQMTHLFSCIESPVLTDVSVSFDGVDVDDVYPEHVPDLFLGQPVLIYGRIVKGQAGTVRLTGQAGGETYESNIAFATAKATFHPGITTLWARQRVEELMDQWRAAGERGQADLKAEIVAQAIRYRLVTRFTSLVAVEQVVANTSGDSQTVPVPTELPDGWKMEGVFGTPATGTADAFFEALGVLLLCVGVMLLWLIRKAEQVA